MKIKNKIMLRQFLILLFAMVCQFSIAQPHIEGDIEIDMKLGLIKCDFTLSQLPKIPS